MIRVTDNYGINASDRCYEVGKIAKTAIKNKDTGVIEGEREYIANASYASTLPDALKLIRKKMHLEAIQAIDGDLKAAVEAIRRCDELFEEKIQSIL